MSSATKSDAHAGPDPEQIKGAMQWDLWNPWATYYEINSTHPLAAKRMLALSDQAAALGQTPAVVFDRAKPESYWRLDDTTAATGAVSNVGAASDVAVNLGKDAGTYQNSPAFANRIYLGMAGRYLFRLHIHPGRLHPGSYRIAVRVTDDRKNRSTTRWPLQIVR